MSNPSQKTQNKTYRQTLIAKAQLLRDGATFEDRPSSYVPCDLFDLNLYGKLKEDLRVVKKQLKHLKGDWNMSLRRQLDERCMSTIEAADSLGANGAEEMLVLRKKLIGRAIDLIERIGLEWEPEEIEQQVDISTPLSATEEEEVCDEIQESSRNLETVFCNKTAYAVAVGLLGETAVTEPQAWSFKYTSQDGWPKTRWLVCDDASKDRYQFHKGNRFDFGRSNLRRRIEHERILWNEVLFMWKARGSPNHGNFFKQRMAEKGEMSREFYRSFFNSWKRFYPLISAPAKNIDIESDSDSETNAQQGCEDYVEPDVKELRRQKVLQEIANEWRDAEREFKSAKHERNAKRKARKVKRSHLRAARQLPNAEDGWFTFRHQHEMNHRFPEFNKLLESLGNFRGAIDWMQILKEIGFFIGHITVGGATVKTVSVAALHLLSNLPLGALYDDMLALMKRIFSIVRRTNAQASSTNIWSLVTAGVGLCVATLFGLMMSRLPQNKDLDSFLLRFSKIGHCIGSFERINDTAQNMTKAVISFFKRSLYGVDDDDLNAYKEIEDFCDEVQKLNYVNVERELYDGSRVNEKLATLLIRGDEIRKTLDALRLPANSTTRFSNSVLFLNRLRNKASETPVGILRQRIPPILVHFSGNTGVGKSGMLAALCTNILVALGCTDPTDLDNKVHFRNPISQNWDGLKPNTKIVVYDDFAAIKDTENNPSAEVLEQLHVNKNAPYRPPMAALGDKASVVLEPAATIWTTNREYFKFDSLTNAEAVVNRVDLRFHQYPRPEFSKCKNIEGEPVITLDGAKVAEAAKTDIDATRNCLMFDQLATSGAPPYKRIRKGLTFDQMCALVLEEMKNKREVGKLVTDDRKTYFQRVVESQKAAETPVPVAAPVEDAHLHRYSDKTFGICTSTICKPRHHHGAGNDCFCSVPHAELPYIQATMIPIQTAIEGMRIVEPNAESGEDEDVPALHEVFYGDREGMDSPNTTTPSSLWVQRTGREKSDPEDFFDILMGFGGLDQSVLMGSNAEYARYVKGIHGSQGNMPKQYAWSPMLWKKHWWQYGCCDYSDHIHVTGSTRRIIKSTKEIDDVIYRMRRNIRDESGAEQMAAILSPFFDAPCVRVWRGNTDQVARDLAFAEIALACGVENRGVAVHLQRLVDNIQNGNITVCGWHTSQELPRHASALKQAITNRLEEVGTKSAQAYQAWVKHHFGSLVDLEIEPEARWAQATTYNIITCTAFNILVFVGSYWLAKKLISLTFSAINGTVNMISNGISTVANSIYGYFSSEEDFNAQGRLDAEGNVCLTPYDAPEIFEAARNYAQKNNKKIMIERDVVEVKEATKDELEAFSNAEAYQSGGARAPARKNFESNANSSTDDNAMNIRAKVAGNQYAIITGDEPNKGVYRGTATFINGRIFLTNRHIVKNLKKFVALRQQGVIKYAFESKHLNAACFEKEDEKDSLYDMALVECPRSVRIHADLTKFFMTKKDFAAHHMVDATSLIGYSHSAPDFGQRIVDTRHTISESSERFELRTDTETTYMREHYHHQGQTGKGDCGSLLISFDTRFPRKICGMHIAASDKHGYTGVAVAIHQERLKRLSEKLNLKFKDSAINGDVLVPIVANAHAGENGAIEDDSPLPPAFTYLGKVITPVHSSGKTNIRPSPVAACFAPLAKLPARLTRFKGADGTIVDPLSKAMAKAAHAAVSLDTVKLEAAKNDVLQMITSHHREGDCRTLTFEEAISGVPGDERFPPIERSSSAGYGWPKGNGKRPFLGTDEYVYDNPLLLEKYEEGMRRLEQGQRLGNYWTDTLKDELRSVEKVKEGKTRLFSCGELVQTLLLRRYFDGFVAHMTRNHTRFESCVGINPYSMDWHFLAKRLQQVGKRVVAGDFSNYDGSLPAEAMWAVYDIIEAFYALEDHDPEDDNKRRVLWVEIVNSVHVTGADVYMWTHGQPSGCPFTSLLNSVIHSILTRMAYLVCAEEYQPTMATMKDFNKYVRHNNFGDDDVTNISDAIIPWFNQITMTWAFARFGMTYTDETKNAAVAGSKDLSEIQFLKRAFVYDFSQSRYRGPLDLSTVLEMAAWNKTRSSDQYELTAEVLQEAVYELSIHSEEVWNEHIPKFEKARKIISAVYPITFDNYATLNTSEYNKWVLLEPKQNDVIFDQTQSRTESDQLLSSGRSKVKTNAQAGEGGVFTSIDTPTPSGINRLCIPRAEMESLSGPHLEGNSLANIQQQINNPTTTNNDTEEWREFIKTFQNCLNAFIGIVDKKTASPNWNPKRETVQNTMRSIVKANNAILTMSGDPGSLRKPEDSVQEALALLYVDDVHAPIVLKGEDTVDSEHLCDTDEIDVNELSASDVIWASTPNPYLPPRDQELKRKIRKALKAKRRINAQSGDGGEVMVELNQQTEVKEQEILTMHEEGNVETAEMKPTTVVEQMQCGARDLKAHTVHSFLGRPIEIATFRWNKSATPDTNLVKLKFPRDWLSFPMIQEKLAGFRFLRCTLVVEVQVNAQPFNAGGILCWFNPLEELLQQQPSYMSHWAGRMGCPHVMYRCNESTAVRMKIPFFPMISHYDLVRGYGTSGVLRLDVFSQLSGLDEVDGAVFVWAEDIDTQMPTGVPLHVPEKAINAESFGEQVNATNLFDIAKNLPGALNLEDAPEITDFINTAEKIVTDGAMLATAFGWSKPTQADTTTNVNIAHNRFQGNATGASDARVLALDAKNFVRTPMEIFGTTQDEMAFKNIIQRPGYIARFKMATGLIQGTELYKFPADPCLCDASLFKDSAHPEVNYFARYETSLSYVSGCAAYWRGPLKYRLQIFKTSFHSGRIRVTFVPGASESTLAKDVDLSKCYSQVYDLRQRTDIDFEVPYSYNQPWRPTNVGKQQIEDQHQTVWSQPQGYVYVTVVNALRAPASVSDTIEFVLYGSAGKGFQFAVPYINSRIKPYYFAEHVHEQSQVASNLRFPNAQSGDAYPSKCPVENVVNVHGIGETFTGFRQWLKRTTLCPVEMATEGRELEVFRFLDSKVDDEKDPEKVLERKLGPFQMAAILYRFYAGSVRAFIESAGDSGDLINTVEVTGFPGVFPPLHTDPNVYGFPVFNIPMTDLPAEIQVPFYQPWPAMPTGVGNPRESFIYDDQVDNYDYMPYNKGSILRVNAGVKITKMAAAEDFSFGYLLGPPATVSRQE